MTLTQQILEAVPLHHPVTTGWIAKTVNRPSAVVAVLLRRLARRRKIKCSRVRVRRSRFGRGSFTWWRAK